MKKFVHKHCTVLCKRNESEVHRILSFVLTKVHRNFATEFLTTVPLFAHNTDNQVKVP